MQQAEAVEHKSKSPVKNRYPYFFESINDILSMLSSDPDSSLTEFYSTGDKADLRRMRPGVQEQRPFAFWRLLSRYGVLHDITTGKKSYLTPDEESKWVAVIQGMAMTADLCHNAKYDFGEALGYCEPSEDALTKRFDQLLRATPERFVDLLHHMLKLLISKDCAFNWDSLAALILTPSERERNVLLSRLAQSYYGTREKARFASENK